MLRLQNYNVLLFLHQNYNGKTNLPLAFVVFMYFEVQTKVFNYWDVSSK